MSFRFVGTALSVLGASSASGYYLGNPVGLVAHAPPMVVVPVTHHTSPSAVPQAVASAPPVAVTVAVVAATAPAATVPPAADSPPPFKVTEGVYWRPRVWVNPGTTHNPLTGAPLTREESETGWVDAPPVEAPQPVAVATATPPPAPAPMVTVVATAPWVAPMAPVGTGAPQANDGSYRIHLESYHNSHLVDSGWTKLRRARPAVLGHLTPSTVTVTVPKKGTFVRLLAGPFATKEAAEHACATLRKTHQYCHPLAPGHETI